MSRKVINIISNPIHNKVIEGATASPNRDVGTYYGTTNVDDFDIKTNKITIPELVVDGDPYSVEAVLSKSFIDGRDFMLTFSGSAYYTEEYFPIWLQIRGALGNPPYGVSYRIFSVAD